MALQNGPNNSDTYGRQVGRVKLPKCPQHGNAESPTCSTMHRTRGTDGGEYGKEAGVGVRDAARRRNESLRMGRRTRS